MHKGGARSPSTARMYEDGSRFSRIVFKHRAQGGAAWQNFPTMHKRLLTALLFLGTASSALALDPSVYAYAEAIGKNSCGGDTTFGFAAKVVPKSKAIAEQIALDALVRSTYPGVTQVQRNNSHFFVTDATHVCVAEWYGGSAKCGTRSIIFQFGKSMNEVIEKARLTFKNRNDASTAPDAVLRIIRHAPIGLATDRIDSDGDGYADAEEARRGTDPNAPTPVVNQPDASIGLSSVERYGKQYYNSTDGGQTLIGRATLKKSRNCVVWVQNAGKTRDTIGVQGSAGTEDVTVRYMHGLRNVTARVIDGTFKLPGLVPGKAAVLKAIVTFKSTAAVGDTFALRVDTTSGVDGTAKDRVGYDFTAQ